MKENIQKSQRIERFAVRDDTGTTVATGTVVGYKKIVVCPQPVHTKRLEIDIQDARVYPTLSFIGVY